MSAVKIRNTADFGFLSSNIYTPLFKVASGVEMPSHLPPYPPLP
jgi:hypothetical protein